MRAIVLILLITLITMLSGRAMAAGKDKILHFAGSAAITAITYAITDDARVAIAAGLGAGIAKEFLDSRKGGTGFDKHDLAADVLGVGLGIAVTFEF